MPLTPASRDELAEVGRLIGAWAAAEKDTNPLVTAVDHDAPTQRWFVRMKGEDREYITVWLTLRQRTLHVETQFMPAPEENLAELYEYLLRVNNRIFGVYFAIGDEEAVYLVGQIGVEEVDNDALDRLVGSSYAYVEQYFRTAMRIGYRSKYRG